MTVVALDPRLADLIDLDATPEKIAGGYTFTEGPVWNQREKALLFVNILFTNPEGATIQRWTQAGGAEVFRSRSMNSNGNTYDQQGRLITCVGDTHSVVRTNADGSLETLADSHDGKPLNSPNDVVCAPNGDLYFTDPYFAMRGEAPSDPPPVPAVYRIAASDGSLTRLTDLVTAPNGIVVSNDGTRLYVDHTREANVYVFDIAADGSLSNGRVFCQVNTEGLPRDFVDKINVGMPEAGPLRRAPDGMKMDSQGNLYVAANRNEGIWVFDPSGQLLGCIGLGEEKGVFGDGLGGPANLAWGDDDWKTLYATTVASVYRIRMKVAGQPVNSA